MDTQEEDISVNELVYRRVKSMIMRGRLAPKQKLVHNDLATALEVSRTPVREALERLYQEGYVTRLPRRGFYVAEITRDEALALYDARSAIECHLLERAFESGISKEDIASLREVAGQYGKLVKESMMKERTLLDVKFHIMLGNFGRNPILTRHLEQVLERLTLKRRMEGYEIGRGIQAAEEHFGLIEAIARGDKADAVNRLRNHIAAACTHLLRFVDNEDDGSQSIAVRKRGPKALAE